MSVSPVTSASMDAGSADRMNTRPVLSNLAAFALVLADVVMVARCLVELE